MRVVYPRCCGLDVHQETVVACVRLQGRGRRVTREVRTFGTTTGELLGLAAWLAETGCTHVAMESTGVYWRPVWNVLDGAVVLILANAREVKAVPGRKTDVKDCAWLADLLAHGLVRASFVPPAPIRELRELTRYRKTVIRQRVAEANRVHKLLESANIKLAPVISDVLGASGRAMLQALVRGERDPRALAELARGVMRRKEPRLVAALEGRFTTHHAVLLKHLLGHLEYLEQLIAILDRQIAELVAPFQRELDLLRTIPGVQHRTAEVLVAEIGVDMGRFPTAAHLASWAGVCPGNNESAGKRRSGRTQRGDRWLRTALIEAAWAAARTRGTYLAGLYARLARRRGPKKAVMAVGHSMLVSAYHLLHRGVPYADLGPRHFDQLRTARQIRYHIRRLQDLGHPLPETATA